MLCINTCDVDTVAVMSNTVNDRICQRTGVSTKLVISFFKTILRTKDRGGFLTSSMQKLKNVFLFDFCWFQQKPFIENENQRIGVFSHDLSIGTIRPCHFQINKQIRKTDIPGIVILLAGFHAKGTGYVCFSEPVAPVINRFRCSDIYSQVARRLINSLLSLRPEV